MEVEDVAGKKKLPLQVIVTHSINFLKDNCFTNLKTKYNDLRLSDILFVLTVPAIWSEKAKEFMRNSAVKVCLKTIN